MYSRRTNFASASPRRRGFSMVEALMAVTVTTIAGTALLTSIGAAVRTSTGAAHTAVARGLAEQMMDEIAARRFPESSNPPPAGKSRENFDDIDDYDGWSARPPQGRSGRVLGTEGGDDGSNSLRPAEMQADLELLGRFTRRVEVERVQPDGGSGWNVVAGHTNFRRVTVRVEHTDAESKTATLAEISRIFAYVPVAP